MVFFKPLQSRAKKSTNKPPRGWTSRSMAVVYLLVSGSSGASAPALGFGFFSLLLGVDWSMWFEEDEDLTQEITNELPVDDGDDADGGDVGQFEHTVHVTEGGPEVLTVL
jgi:hypothetical protein